MKVKKRAVWFLTLLSLAAVISVYYFTDSAKQFDGINIFSDDSLNDTALNGEATDENQTPVFAQNFLFEEMRMEVMNERSQQRELLESKITSDSLTVEEKNDAWTQMEDLSKRTSIETMLEMLIHSLGYSDVFVKTTPGKVQVRVVSDEISKAQANDIIYTVKSEWEDAREVQVKFESP